MMTALNHEEMSQVELHQTNLLLNQMIVCSYIQYYDIYIAFLCDTHDVTLKWHYLVSVVNEKVAVGGKVTAVLEQLSIHWVVPFLLMKMSVVPWPILELVNPMSVHHPETLQAGQQTVETLQEDTPGASVCGYAHASARVEKTWRHFHGSSPASLTSCWEKWISELMMEKK